LGSTGALAAISAALWFRIDSRQHEDSSQGSRPKCENHRMLLF
jgi:hypothetical protein